MLMAPLTERSPKKLVFGFVLILASTILSLIVVEVVLRTVAHERYQSTRMLTSVPDNTKIWAPPKNSVQYFRHPDTGERIELLRNNLGLRMNRDVFAHSLKGQTNIAFFGASFTESVRLNVPYTFPEVLKNLINIGFGKVEVLNFGVGGYGVDQSYLRYKELPTDIRSKLGLVAILVSPSNLWNPAKHKIAALDENRKLIFTPRGPRIPTFANVIKEFDTTYFIIEAYDLIVNLLERNTKSKRKETTDAIEVNAKAPPKKDEAIRLFNALMLQWQGDVEAFGGKFKIVIVPLDDYWSITENLDSRLSAIDLHELFAEMVADDELPKLSFQNDSHWNETGNLIAAVALSKALRPVFSLPKLEDATLVKELHNYYGNISHGWQPDPIGTLQFGKVVNDGY